MSAKFTLAGICRWSLILTFAWAGLSKLSGPGSFSVNLQNYHILPVEFNKVLAYLIPVAELALAVWLAIRPRDFAPPVIAGLFAIAFLTFNASAILRGLDIECGCFGSTSGRVNFGSLFLNLVMLCMSFYLGSAAKESKRTTKILGFGALAIVLSIYLSIWSGDGELSYQPVIAQKQTPAPSNIPTTRKPQDPPTPSKSSSPTELLKTGTAEVEFSPPMLELGEVKLGESVRRSVQIANRTGQTLEVTAIGLGCHCMKVWLPSTTLPPDSVSEMVVKYTAGPQTGSFELGIGLKTRELENPLKYIVTVFVPDNKPSRQTHKSRKSTKG